jgi:hypothetical protein
LTRDVQALIVPAAGQADRAPIDPRQLAADCWSGVWMLLAELEGVLTPGNGSTLIAFLVETTEPSAGVADPASLRIEHFLTGYYLGTCAR